MLSWMLWVSGYCTEACLSTASMPTPLDMFILVPLRAGGEVASSDDGEPAGTAGNATSWAAHAMN